MIKIKTLLKTATNWAGQKIVFPRGREVELTAQLVEIAPGRQTGWHKHPVPVFGYVLSGAITVELADGTKHTHRAGKAAAESVNLFHNGVNKGKKPVKIVVFIAGKKNVPNTVYKKTGKKEGSSRRSAKRH